MTNFFYLGKISNYLLYFRLTKIGETFERDYE